MLPDIALPTAHLQCAAYTDDGLWVLGTDIEYGTSGTGGVGGNEQSLNDAQRIALKQDAIHECPRVTLVAIADDVFFLVHSVGHKLPFTSRGEAAAATSPDTAAHHLVDDGLPSDRKGTTQRLETALTNIFVGVERIHQPISLGRYAKLTLKEIVDATGTQFFGQIENAVPGLVGMESIHRAPDTGSQSAQARDWTEMMEKYLLHLVGTYVRIAGDPSVGCDDIDERHLTTGTHTRHGFYAHTNARFPAGAFDSLPYRGRSAGLAAVFHTETYLALGKPTVG